MKHFLLLSLFGFLMARGLGRFCYGFYFLLCMSIYLYIRFKKRCLILIWLIISIILLDISYQKPKMPPLGEYEIVEIKPNYCFGKSGNSMILLYGIERPSFYDVYKVEKLERISSIKNIGLFNFEEYCKKKNVFYFANCDVGDYKYSHSSIRSKLFLFFLNHKNSDFYLSYLYGIHDESIDEIILCLGFPILCVLSFLRMFLRKFFSSSISDILVLFIGILYGWLFLFTPSLIRILVFILSNICFEKWEQRVVFSVYMYAFILPEYVLDFVFLYPLCIRFIHYFCTDLIRRFVLSRLTLFLFILSFFNRIDFVNFLFFELFRKINSVIFLLSLPGVYFDKLFSLILKQYYQWVDIIPERIYVYVPGIFFIFVLMILIYRIYTEKKIAMCSSILMVAFFLGPYIDPFFHVFMIDIGQGDCTLIVEPFKKSAVMIDCGQNLRRDNVESIVVPFLETRHIHALDAVIVTHDDFDHSGGVNKLCECIDVKKVIRSSLEEIPVDYPFHSLVPERKSKDENDRSIISYFCYDDIKYLWMGDASVDVEEQILSMYPTLDVNVCKLGHHGSGTSSSYKFLDSYRFDLALISVGKNNRYGHPSTRVVTDAKQLGIEVLMSKDVGMVELFSCKGLVMFRTQTGLIGFL